jgi:hypothetical protein
MENENYERRIVKYEGTNLPQKTTSNKRELDKKQRVTYTPRDTARNTRTERRPSTSRETSGTPRRDYGSTNVWERVFDIGEGVFDKIESWILVPLCAIGTVILAGGLIFAIWTNPVVVAQVVLYLLCFLISLVFAGYGYHRLCGQIAKNAADAYNKKESDAFKTELCEFINSFPDTSPLNIPGDEYVWVLTDEPPVEEIPTGEYTIKVEEEQRRIEYEPKLIK